MPGLQDLAQSIFAALGFQDLGDGGLNNSLKLPYGERIALLLVDGLGHDAVAKYGANFSSLSELHQSHTLHSTFPSTTATALATLGTGVLPGIHGMLGYTVRVPRSGEPGRLLNALKWDERVDPTVWQSQRTLYERTSEQGINSAYIGAKRYEGTGFSRATLRGAQYLGANRVDEMISHAKAALSQPRSFAYLYVNNLDHAGHNDGVGSDKWLDAFAFIDDLVRRLTQELPAGTHLLVSADHGMINVEEKMVLGQDNNLLTDVTLIGGEPRARHIYIREGAVEDVMQRWKSVLGDKADIFTKNSVTPLIGSDISRDSHERLGDLIVVPRAGLILIDPEREVQEGKMIGHHGGTTQTEVEIPLLQATL